jgi:hypothetical protein
MKLFAMISTTLLLLCAVCQAQQAVSTEQAATTSRATTVQVDISTTISGNQEQPRTLYVLPWQDSIAQIRIPAPEINVAEQPLQPLDRQQFLRFIEAQSLQQPSADTASSKNN